MNRFSLLLAVLGPAIGAPALAADPPYMLLAGALNPSLVNSGTAWCSSGAGNTSFIRNATGNAEISFGEIDYGAFPTYYRLSGQAQLVFSSATGGKIYFGGAGAYPATIARPAFSSYSQSWDSNTNTLVVHVKIRFPSCILPITAIYRS